MQDVFALLHVVSDHTDSAALMRLLATPRFAVEADDLQALADTAERQIVVNVPQLGTIVNGKLDAVFFGGLNEKDQSKRYTIVDWKTGKKPRKKEEIQEKLVQLDMYRLLLSAMEGVPLDAIDACLYYLSEPVEGNRQLNAADKTEEEILAELSYGIPKQSDND